MVRIRLSKALRARLVVILGAAGLTGGVFEQFGLGWAGITAGALATAYGLLVMDVDGEDSHG